MVAAMKIQPRDVHLIKGTFYRSPQWYYVKVDPKKKPLLEKALTRKETIFPEDYGTVIFSGPGEEPPIYYRKKIEAGDYSE